MRGMPALIEALDPRCAVAQSVESGNPKRCAFAASSSRAR